MEKGCSRDRKEALGVAEEGKGAPTTELRGFLNHQGLRAFHKYANFGALRPTQKSLALAGARWGGS